MMKYLGASFSVTPGLSEEYRRNFDRVFGKKTLHKDKSGLFDAVCGNADVPSDDGKQLFAQDDNDVNCPGCLEAMTK